MNRFLVKQFARSRRVPHRVMFQVPVESLPDEEKLPLIGCAEIRPSPNRHE